MTDSSVSHDRGFAF